MSTVPLNSGYSDIMSTVPLNGGYSDIMSTVPLNGRLNNSRCSKSNQIKTREATMSQSRTNNIA